MEFGTRVRLKPSNDRCEFELDRARSKNNIGENSFAIGHETDNRRSTDIQELSTILPCCIEVPHISIIHKYKCPVYRGFYCTLIQTHLAGAGGHQLSKPSSCGSSELSSSPS